MNVKVVLFIGLCIGVIATTGAMRRRVKLRKSTHHVAAAVFHPLEPEADSVIDCEGVGSRVEEEKSGPVSVEEFHPVILGATSVIDCEEIQPKGLSPVLFSHVQQLLYYPLDTFSLDSSFKCSVTDCYSLAGCSRLDEDSIMVRKLFSGILRPMGTMYSRSENLLFGDLPTLSDLFDRIEEYASENKATCAAVFEKNGRTSIIAVKGSQWIFVNFDYQSELKRFAAGAHVILFSAREYVLDYLEKLCGLLKTDTFEDDWQATFYCQEKN